MTVYATCRGCKRIDECEILASIKKAVKGFGVTTVKHRCDTREPEFMPGDSVIVKTKIGEPDTGFSKNEFSGTFIAEAKDGPKVICFIKPGTEGLDGDEFWPMEGKKGYVKVPRSRVRKGDGEHIVLTMCDGCCGYPVLTGECGLEPEYRMYSDCKLAKKEAA